MDARRLAPTLVVCGLALLVGTAVLGPALASPPAGSAGAGTATATAADPPTADAGSPETLVSVQGVGSYTANGYVARLNGTREVWREESADVYFGATRLGNDSVLVATTTGDHEDCGPYEAPCPRTGYRVVDPSPAPRVVSEWTFPVRSHPNSEVHDVEPLPGGGYVVADMDRERVFVVKGGEVTWEWRASERYDPPADPTRTDWLHINDVDRIGEGRFLVSVRNANQLVVLERGEGVVDVINEDHDGDGRGDPSVIHQQHNPQWLGDGAVLVADSENHRIVELHRTADGDWEPAWVLTGAGGQRFDWPRDADRLPNGNTLITDTRNARLVEVNESGAVVWSTHLDYRALPYEADRVPHGEPVGAPRYAVEDAPDGTATPTTPHESVAGSDRIPLLTPALRLLTAAVRVPRWFAEPHLLAVLLGVASVGTGAVVGWSARRE